MNWTEVADVMIDVSEIHQIGASKTWLGDYRSSFQP
jgi:hypothetical protein